MDELKQIVREQYLLLRLDEKEHSDVLDGKTFGSAGAYERIVGRAYFALDPTFRSDLASALTTLRVTYLDTGTGSFNVSWGTGPTQTVTITKTNTGSWQTTQMPVAGIDYTGGLAWGADITVSELGSDSTDFQMVEVAVAGR